MARPMRRGDDVNAASGATERRQRDRLDESGAPVSEPRRGAPGAEDDRAIEEKVRARAYERYLSRQTGREGGTPGRDRF